MPLLPPQKPLTELLTSGQQQQRSCLEAACLSNKRKTASDAAFTVLKENPPSDTRGYVTQIVSVGKSIQILNLSKNDNTTL